MFYFLLYFLLCLLFNYLFCLLFRLLRFCGFDGRGCGFRLWSCGLPAAHLGKRQNVEITRHQRHIILQDILFVEVDNRLGVEILVHETGLEVEHALFGVSGGTRLSDHLSGLDNLVRPHTQLVEMCIDGFETVVVAHHHHRPVIAIVAGHAHHAVETALHQRLRLCLEVNTRMETASLLFAVCRLDLIELARHDERVVGILHEHQHQTVVGEGDLQQPAAKMQRVPIALVETVRRYLVRL